MRRDEKDQADAGLTPQELSGGGDLLQQTAPGGLGALRRIDNRRAAGIVAGKEYRHDARIPPSTPST